MMWDALVLAGGGVAGIAWETGVLLGLMETDPSIAGHLVADETRYIGTSAGATVAAQFASGTPPQELFDAQIAGSAQEIAVSVDFRTFGATMIEAMAAATSPEDARRRVGAIARAADTPEATARRSVIESRLPTRSWPARDLRVTAVDTGTGELRVFDRTSGVELVDAVAASAAVPGIWPCVEIEGTFYMDGGIPTVANADLAAGAERVLILVPSADTTPMGPAITPAELDALSGSRVQIVYADEDSLAAIGFNPLDPETRGPAARAGRQVGQKAAKAVASLWD